MTGVRAVIKSRLATRIRRLLYRSVSRRVVYRDELSKHAVQQYSYGQRSTVSTNVVPAFDGHEEYKQTYSIEPWHIYELPEMILFRPGGTALTESGDVILESAADNVWNLVERLYHQVKNPQHFSNLVGMYRLMYGQSCPDISEQYGVVFPMTYQPYSGYYHWVAEYLPKLRYYERYRQQPGIDPLILVGSNASKWVTESIEMITDANVMRCPPGPVKVDKLVLPSHYRHHPEDYNPRPEEYRWVREQMVSSLPETGSSGPARIYVSREDATDRRVLNERAVESVLAEFGFEKLVLSELSVHQQVSIFSQAETIVGPHGAGLVNMIFAENADVLELVPENLVFPFYQCLSDHLGHEYEHLTCELSGTNLVVDPETVREAVADVLATG